MIRGPGCPRRGLTLVEVLVALTILAVILLPVMVGFSQALITTSQSSITAVATSIAREKIEELKLRPYELIQSQPGEHRDLRPGDSYFEVEATVTENRPDDAAHSGLKTAVVSVYRSGSARPLVTLSTYFTPAGV
jgi:prepilin-type N-terminal cleavage/methylation domain-containing protein